MSGKQATEAEILAVEAEMAEPITLDIKHCARCYRDHDQLTFTPLGHPIEIEQRRPLTHWAPCPENGQPILMLVGKSHG